MITLLPLEGHFSICQISDYDKIPTQFFESGFYSITRTEDEISIVTNCKMSFDNLKSDKNWRGFRVEGILDFSLTGIINEITQPLKENNISVFVISTFNTDYIFVKEESFENATEILRMTENFAVRE